MNFNESAAKYFQCRCTAEHLAKYPAPQYVHRIPIDCWTAEDQDRYDRAIYVVAWVGDQDCGGRNDGPIAVFKTRKEAMQVALQSAIEEATDYDPVEPGEDGFSVGRATCKVVHLMLPKADEEE